MIRDCFGGLHSQGSEIAISSYEMAVREMLRHRAALPTLLHAISLDPEIVAAHALLGFCNILLARRETIAQARDNLENVNARLARNGGLPRELVLAQALGKAVEGKIDSSISAFKLYLDETPDDIVFIKLVHSLQFMSGAGQEMASFTGEMLKRCGQENDGHGYLLGCHAFGLEEAGMFRQAEVVAQSALHRDARDLWAMHALAHVYEMNGRNREGIIWIESARDLWQEAANFSFHLAWHLALFNLNLGKFDRALSIYDQDVRFSRGEDFRDIANAVSLLWRLRQEGVDTGSRFEELAVIAQHRADDTTLIFASLHHLLSLLASSDFARAQGIVASLEQSANANVTAQDAVAREIGAPLARSILGMALNRTFQGNLARLAGSLPRLGGSNAQRDVFMRTLAIMAADAGDRGTLDVILGYRHNLRREDRFLQMIEASALQTTTLFMDRKNVA